MYSSIHVTVIYWVTSKFQILQQAVEHKDEEYNTPLRKLSLAGKYNTAASKYNITCYVPQENYAQCIFWAKTLLLFLV